MSEQSIFAKTLGATKKVLIVEDEKTQRFLLAKHLGDSGYEILQAEDGEAAFEILTNDPEIRLVVTDLMMPRMDGFELIKKIRKTELRYTYILVQTNRDDEEALYRALALGADDFLTKPVRAVELRLRLESGIRLIHIEKFEELVFFLTKLAALQSKETSSHLDRMYHLTRILARDLAKTHPELGMTNAVAEGIARVSPLHDLGKVAISSALLHKSEKLSHQEVCRLQEHAKIGGELIKEVYEQTDSPYLYLAFEIAMFHHERWDGNGYPLGLAGNKIPLCARIVALADAYDAMTSTRCYQLVLTHAEAKAEIVSKQGKQFDPMVVESFLRQEVEFQIIKEQHSEL
ncbi:MAG: response regulator [Desulfobulbaceae bacterium]|nr:response regulator [Desulfobulbaceae bacterium]HIJ79655.1 response regulator [Deltaproteobacteria bacterium]